MKEGSPRLSEEPSYPSELVTAAQLIRACDCLTLLETQAEQYRSAYTGRFNVSYDQVIEDTKRGVRLIIFARYRDVIAQGGESVAQEILAKELRRPETAHIAGSTRGRPRTP